VLVPERVEFLANVLILIPAIALGALLWPRFGWRDWTAYGFVFSGAVEAVQAVILDERSATYVDGVANTLGAFGAFGGAAVIALATIVILGSSRPSDNKTNM
jgi:glycopeptide antibiotics resistance protein